ncbi:hypothetical protein [Phenylobacterium sp.]|uniref:hypothetical protein n=1 Tax=Phenylobacterium sp. TaxID=1871053 RepID=UPI0027355CA1|nr:hypothetical protein [Phenylobacterium sp.]MDP3854389.1 hypothetical protein [Phenylobacterium sp.]
MTPISPETPPALRALLAELAEVVRAWRAPGAPSSLYACDADQLPDAGDWPNGLVLVSDLNILAHSDGSSWIRQDTGAAI